MAGLFYLIFDKEVKTFSITCNCYCKQKIVLEKSVFDKKSISSFFLKAILPK